MEQFDLVIIGAGPIGLACGIEAKKAGLSYLIIDKGCLVNSIYNYPRGMIFFSTSERLEIGDIPFISHQAKPNRFEALEYYRRVTSSWQLNVKLYERVVEANRNNNLFEIVSEKGRYNAENMVMATGFYDYPYLLNIEGEDLPKVRHYYNEPHPYFGQKLIVVGGANSAVDVALETFRKGAEVTMVIRDEAIKETVKYWAKPDIENRIAAGEIKAYFNAELTKITKSTVEIQTTNKKIILDNDFVLAMTGYKPDFKFLEALGVEFQDDEYHTPLYDEKTNESNSQNVYLAGVVCGGLKTNKWIIENSRDHANLIISAIKLKKEKRV